MVNPSFSRSLQTSKKSENETVFPIHTLSSYYRSNDSESLLLTSLIEDSLSDGYDFVLKFRFQSDQLEKCYGHYRQISGGRFLVSVMDIAHSENVLKLKSLVKEGFDIGESLKTNNDHSEATA